MITGHIDGALARAVEAIGPGITFRSKDDIQLASFGMVVRELLSHRRAQPVSAAAIQPLPVMLTPAWYPYLRDGAFALLTMLVACGLYLRLGWMRQDHQALRQEQAAQMAEVQKTHARMEKVMGELIQVLTKRSQN